MQTPYLAIATNTPQEGEDPKVLFSTETNPIFAKSKEAVKQVVFTKAVRANKVIDPGEVQVFVLPFVRV